MSYDRPERRMYMWNALDWHAGALTRYVQGPKGKRGRVVEVGIAPTTSFVGTATPANVQVGYGNGANLYAYANVPVGAANAGTQVGAVVVASDYAGGLTAMNPANVPMVSPGQLPAADTPLIVTFNPATGGGVAGVADVWVVVDWS